MTSIGLHTIYAFERLCAAVILLISSLYVWRLVRYYTGVSLQRSWLLLLGGILVFAVAQITAGFSALIGSDALRVVGGTLAIIGSLSILAGLLRFAEAWKKLQF
jgi:hypothetical protein